MKTNFLIIALLLFGAALVFKGPMLDTAGTGVDAAKQVQSYEVPQWFENTIYMIGALAGLNTFGRYFLLWSGVLFQGLTALFLIFFMWIATLFSRPTSEAGYKYGFYVGCILAGFAALGEAYMLLTVPGGALMFGFEIFAVIIIVFLSVGGMVSVRGAVESSETSFDEHGQPVKKVSRQGAHVHVGGHGVKMTDDGTQVKWE